MFIADSHISYSEGLSDPYLDYHGECIKPFENKPKSNRWRWSLKPRKQNFDLIILGGDIINIPVRL